MDSTLLLQTLINGLLLGFIYTALAMGLSLTLGILRIVNMAHSVFVLLGAFVAWELQRSFSLDPVLSMVVILPLFFVLGMLLDRLLVRRVAGADDNVVMIVLFGVLIVVESLVILIWTNDTRALRVAYSGVSLPLGELRVPVTRLVAAAVALVVVGAMHSFLQRSLVGKAIRAMASNREAAMQMGIDVGWLSMIAFGIGIASAAIGGVTAGMVFTFAPPDHMQWMALSFIVVMIGGLGSLRNTLVAALFVGLVQTFSGIFLPFAYVYLILYLMLALVLMVKGEGLGGQRARVV